MAGKKRRKFALKEGEMPLSAMIDVVFQLLIYFVVTQKPIIENTLLTVDLPAPGGKPKDKPITLFTIDVHRIKQNPKEDLDIYYVNGSKWNFQDLRAQLVKTAQIDPKQTLIINCGPNAKHQKLVQLLDACTEAGLTSINVVNDDTVKFIPDPGTRSK
jgi:biopolymer transport protein ExbD